MKNFLNLLYKAENRIVSAEKTALAVLLCAMIAGSFVQVVLRLAFSSGVLWMDPLLRYFTLWAGFIGAALAAHENKHFALDVTAKLFKGAAGRAVFYIANSLTVIVCAVLADAAVKFIRMEAETGTTLFRIGGFSVPAQWFELILPVGFGLIILHSVFNMLRFPREEARG
ncbi:MAG: TRAP transporter small permease [Elusimicrobiaceae bacterium]|nr:TRAP transporter small permease [Elusimicrobiaceae bacterium]